MVIATKGRFPIGPGANDVGLSRVHLTRALDASLRRLGSDHVDLYQAHAWDPLTPIEETLRFFDDAVRAGKIRYVGVSNFTGWQLQKAVLLSRFLGLAPIVTLQPQYNLLARDIELELPPVCGNEGIGVLPWSPLGGGWLTGKYRRDAPPTGATRLGENPQRGVEAYDGRNRRSAPGRSSTRCGRSPTARGVSMAAVALAWLADRPAVTSVILGARTLEQLDDNLAAADLISPPRRRPGSTRRAPRWSPTTRTAGPASASAPGRCPDGAGDADRRRRARAAAVAGRGRARGAGRVARSGRGPLEPARHPSPDLAVAADWVARRADWSGDEHASLAISAAGTDELLGSVSLFRIDRLHDNAEMGYWVAARARGRGVAVTAVRALTDWSFTILGLARVQLFHAVENPASCRVAEKAGYRLEGTARQSYRYGDGVLHDEHLHGRLATDPAD